MTKAKDKDRILQYLLDNKKTKPNMYSPAIADALHLTITTCNVFIREIANDGYIDAVEISAADEYRTDFACRLLDAGEYFILHEGYAPIERKRRYSSNWNTTMNTIIAISTAGMFLFSFKACESCSKASEPTTHIKTLSTK